MADINFRFVPDETHLIAEGASGPWPSCSLSLLHYPRAPIEMSNQPDEFVM